MEEKIKGVFSTQEVHKVGTGTTTRKSIRKSFWYATELDGEEEKIEIQPLNANYIPAGPKRFIDKDQFLKDFSPEPEFYVSTVFPKMRELNKTVARAERHRNNGELFSAEMEFNNALKVDEENVRANFGLGLTYMERGDTAKAENILDRIVKLDAAFDTEHKHLFNEFGIQLRKNKMFKNAIEYYTRALELSKTDENLFYNIARAHLENKDPASAAKFLLQGIEINPRLPEAGQFLLWMLNKSMIPAEMKDEVVGGIKKVKEALENPVPAAPAPEAAPAQAPAAQENPAGQAASQIAAQAAAPVTQDAPPPGSTGPKFPPPPPGAAGSAGVARTASASPANPASTTVSAGQTAPAASAAGQAQSSAPTTPAGAARAIGTVGAAVPPPPPGASGSALPPPPPMAARAPQAPAAAAVPPPPPGAAAINVPPPVAGGAAVTAGVPGTAASAVPPPPGAPVPPPPPGTGQAAQTPGIQAAAQATPRPPVQPAQPGQPVQPFQTGQAGQPVQPSQSSHTGQPVHPGQAAQPGMAGRPNQPVQAGQAAGPGQQPQAGGTAASSAPVPPPPPGAGGNTGQ